MTGSEASPCGFLRRRGVGAALSRGAASRISEIVSLGWYLSVRLPGAARASKVLTFGSPSLLDFRQAPAGQPRASRTISRQRPQTQDPSPEAEIKARGIIEGRSNSTALESTTRGWYPCNALPGLRAYWHRGIHAVMLRGSPKED